MRAADVLMLSCNPKQNVDLHAYYIFVISVFVLSILLHGKGTPRRDMYIYVHDMIHIIPLPWGNLKGYYVYHYFI